MEKISMWDVLKTRDAIQKSAEFEHLDQEERLSFKKSHEVQQKLLMETLSDREKAVYHLFLEDKS